MRIRRTASAVAFMLSLIAASQAQARTDHLRCYQVKDPLSLAAVADLTSELGLAPGCKVSKARTYCEQSDSDIVSAVDKKTGVALALLPVTGSDSSDRVCYKVSCPAPAVALADQQVSDTFGTRTLENLKTSLVCTPAVKGAHQPSVAVSYRLQVDAAVGMPDLPEVVFDGGQGLAAVRAVGKHTGDVLPAHNRSAQVEITAAYFLGGAVAGSTDAWATWYQQVQATGIYCDEHTGDECDSAWVASGLGRAATLSAVAEGGEVLASWRLADAWPAGLTLTDPDTLGVSSGILRMTLAAAVGEFSFGDGAGVLPLFGGAAPPPAVTPIDGDGEVQLETFLARYHDLDGALLRLNGLHLLAASSSPPSPPLARQPRWQTDPGRIVVELDGVISGGFKEITGIENEVELIDFRDGDDPITHKRPGRTKTTTVVARKGVVNDGSLLDFARQVLTGVIQPMSGSIIFLDRAGVEVSHFTLFQAWPCRWKAPELNSGSDTHIVEEIEFCVEKVERG